MQPSHPNERFSEGTSAGVADPQTFVSQLIREVPPNREFSAQEILARYPFLNSHRSCVIDLVYEEYCRLRDAGKPVSATAFAAQFRDIEQSLHRVIEFDQILNQHPSLVDAIPEDRWPSVDQTYGGFILKEQIGRGVLSRVFVARQERLGKRQVVAKICLRGEQEASLLGQLAHPSIASVHSIDTDSSTGLSIICMPYLTRVTLHHLAEFLHAADRVSPISTTEVCDVIDRLNAADQLPAASRSLSATADNASHDTGDFLRLFLSWGADLASALQTAHAAGILHCDVKPGNVLLLPDLRVQLMDFNLASSAAGPDRIVGGTMPYMAPEQLRAVLSQSNPADMPSPGSCRISEVSDVFGLAATLWHVATGQPPFGAAVDVNDRDAAAALLLCRQEGGISAALMARAASVLSPEITEILASALSFDAARRPQSAAAFRKILLSAQSCLPAPSARQTESDDVQTATGEPRRNLRRLRAGKTVAGIVCASAVLLSAYSFRESTQQDRREQVEDPAAGSALAIQPATDKNGRTVEQKTITEAAAAIKQRRFREAMEHLEQGMATEASVDSRFLYHYCSSILLDPPLHAEPQNGRGGRSALPPEVASTDMERRQKWKEHADDWFAMRNMSGFSEQMAFNAAVNAVAMMFEIGEFDVVTGYLEKLKIPPGQSRTIDRISICLRLLEFLHGRAELLPTDLQALRQRPCSRLSRYESRILILTLARVLSKEGTFPSDERRLMRAELQQLVRTTSGVSVEPGALIPVMFERVALEDQQLNEWLSERIEQPVERIRNCLEELLVLPGD